MNTKLRSYLLVSILMLCTISSSLSAINPRRVAEDGRIKFVKYNPDNVVRLTTQPGRVTVVELASDEQVLSKAYGKKDDWAIVSKANTVQLGPKSLNGNTNLVIQTNKRLYFIDLIVTKNSGTYKVKYLYDAPLSKNDYLKYGERSWVKKQPNYCYYGFGDKELKPVIMYDDGVFTYFRFTNHLNLPTIYSIGSDGSEAIVASHVDNGWVIVHEISKRFNIRLGKKVLGIVNKGPLRNNFSNFDTTDSSFRKIKK